MTICHWACPPSNILFGALITITAACAGQSAPPDSGVHTPPPELVQFARTKVEADNPNSLNIFENKSLHIGHIGDPANSWLLPLQERTNKYCLFAEAKSNAQELRELASYVSCQMLDVHFSDFNGDGMTDALYKLRIKSNQHDAWVIEEALFLVAPDHQSFCKSVHTPRFAPRHPPTGYFGC